MSKRQIRVFKVINNGLVEVPIWSDHRRARNWCATVAADPHAPGGLRRNFWGQARGQAAEIFKYVLPENVFPCDVIEFGADVMSYGGDRRNTNRWYGVVLKRDDKELAMATCGEKPVDAFRLAAEVRETFLNPKKAPGSEVPPVGSSDEESLMVEFNVTGDPSKIISLFTKFPSLTTVDRFAVDDRNVLVEGGLVDRFVDVCGELGLTCRML